MNWWENNSSGAGTSRPFTERDLFFFSNDPEYSEYRKGVECQECGVAVINTDKHVEFHNKAADL